MVKIQKISEIEPCLDFSELGQQMYLHEASLDRESYFSLEGKNCFSGTRSDKLNVY